MKYHSRFCAIHFLFIVFTRGDSTPENTESDYKTAIKMSLLFYEAQRSGHLPSNNRIPWRGDSALRDQGQNGEDLSGGYYDASDYVKFGFTMAFTTTVLSWGAISYPQGYKSAGQYQNVLDAIKWATDYFVKCHVSKYEFYGQVGDFGIDLKYWGRPEEMNMSRPAYKIDKDHPGSDLAGEVSASLAAASIVFSHVNLTYSKELLRHALELFDFANLYRGLYQEVIPGAKTFYQNGGYEDELTWATIWLYKATGKQKYLNMANSFYETFRLKERPNEFYYNKKVAGIQVGPIFQLLLAQITGDQTYVSSVDSFCQYTVSEQTRTAKGLIFIEKLGTLSHAANIAFICLQAVELDLDEKYANFAKDQIDYMLGKFGRSFVVGFGVDYPKRPHHAASSCPDRPKSCDRKQFFSTDPNPQILYGALVSGPDRSDYYQDIREEFLFNEVTLDYNAGFQSVLVGLIQKEFSARNGTDAQR